MSKYALKLEQLVQTDAYGDILITIQYDGQGPKLVTANGEGLNPEIKHTLDTILGLVNFALAKAIPPVEVGDQLEAEPQDGVHLPINDILLVVAGALKEAPEGINKIGSDILMQIDPGMIKEFTQGISSGEFEQPITSNPQLQKQQQVAPQTKQPNNNQNQVSQQNPQPKQENQQPRSQQMQNQPNQNPQPKPQNQAQNQAQNTQPKQEKPQEEKNENQRGGFFGGFNR